MGSEIRTKAFVVNLFSTASTTPSREIALSLGTSKKRKMSVFTPVSGLLGGSLIGGSAGLLLGMNGDIMGISGIFRSSYLHPTSSRWKLAYVCAFLMSAHLYRGSEASSSVSPSTLALAVGGFLVGLGTKLGNGCTSGHGICGLARMSIRSLTAVLTFCGVGAITASTIATTEVLEKALRTTEPMAENNTWGMALIGVSFAMTLYAKANPVDNKKSLGAVAAGAVASVGMCISGMSKVSKVLGFLEVSRLFSNEKGEGWDPTLMMVMASGVTISLLSYQFRPEKPVCAPQHSIPTSTTIDKRLVGGAVLFGLGWAVAGLCPGPAIWRAGVGTVPVIMYWLPTFGLGSYVGEML